jgi:hypothetical protein
MPAPEPMDAYNSVLLNQALQRQTLPQNLFPMFGSTSPGLANPMPAPEPMDAYNSVLLNQALQRQTLPQNLFPMQ